MKNIRLLASIAAGSVLLSATARAQEADKEGERAWQVWRWPWAVRWSRLFTIVR